MQVIARAFLEPCGDLRGLACEVVLSTEDEAALQQKGSRPLAATNSTTYEPEVEAIESEEFMALHRKQPGQGLCIIKHLR